MSQWVGRSLRWCHPSVTLETVYLQVGVVNSLLSSLPCRMGKIQRSPARPHIPLIFHHLQRKSLQFVCQEGHAPSKRNLGTNLIWLASSATKWPSYCSLDVRSHHQGTSPLAGSLGTDAARRSGKGTPHPPTQMVRQMVQRSDGWWKKVQKLNPTGGRGRGRSGRLRSESCKTGPTPIPGTNSSIN